jgi:hypothetical protein
LVIWEIKGLALFLLLSSGSNSFSETTIFIVQKLILNLKVVDFNTVMGYALGARCCTLDEIQLFPFSIAG